ncbi:MAG: hypothetical protein EZS28_046175, partial [Streblomastix strix]
MVEPYIPDKETQWNMKKDSGCEQVEQGNRETALQNAWTGRSTIPSQLNRLCYIPRPQINQQLCKQNNAFCDKTQSKILRRSNRINPQINMITFRNQNSELLRRHTSNPLRQTNTQNTNNRNNENIRTIMKDNISREMRNRTAIDNIIHGIDKEPEENEYKNVRRKIVENDTSFEGLVQRNIQEQKPQIKRSVSVSNGIGQSVNTSIEDKIMGRDNDSKQNSNQRTEMVDKENRRQSTRIIDQQTITCMLTTDASPRSWGATLIYDNQVELVQHESGSEKEAEMTNNAKEIKAIYYGLIRFEQVFKKMQNQAVLIRSDNTTAVYDIGQWKAKESLIERIKQVF